MNNTDRFTGKARAYAQGRPDYPASVVGLLTQESRRENPRLADIGSGTGILSRAMLERGWGRIINMASVSGLVGVAHKPAYVASKHGLLGLTKSVALELATTPVTCNAICPGWVTTPMADEEMQPLMEAFGDTLQQAYDRVCADVPLRRAASADERALVQIETAECPD